MFYGNGVNDSSLKLYFQEIIKAQEEERLRISRELHDVTIQSLVTVLHQLERYLCKNKSLDMPHVRFLLGLKGQVNTILQEVRYLSQNLRPAILEHLGLNPSIEYLTQTLRSRKVEVWFNLIGPVLRFRPEVELSIFRIVQEALNNIVRHSDATRAKVILVSRREKFMIIIKDNGKGIEDFPQSLDSLVEQGKLGLAGMVERAKLIQGTLKLKSFPGKGTVISLFIPVRENLV